METEAVAALISAGMPGAEVKVTGDGQHFEAVVVSPEFEGRSPLEKQRLVMATVTSEIRSGELHALSIKTFTPEQWQKLQAR
jgi:acid stress-induced BolA-like protein IbaG/YrbA